jgi:predicted alpha/beta superfamily hydrolase
MRIILVAILLLFTIPESTASEKEKRISFESQSLSESRNILVRLPADYGDNIKKAYPVLITLNDEDNFKWASSIVDVQSSRFGIEDMIVVGLPHSGNYSKDNYPFKKSGSIEFNSQAQNYSKFIREEALPYIDKNYRTNGGRFIVGHSLSGLFVTNMFMQYPDSFSAFVVLSPSVQHAPQLSGLLKEYFKSTKTLSSTIYVSLGDMEHQQIQKEFKSLKDVFIEHSPENLTWTVNHMENTDHMLAAFKGVYDGLAWVYKDWYIQDTEMQKIKVDDYIQHYEALSKKLKYDIKPREKHLIGFSWFAKNKLNDSKAAIEAMKAAIHFYPESSDLKEKLKEYEK